MSCKIQFVMCVPKPEESLPKQMFCPNPKRGLLDSQESYEKVHLSWQLLRAAARESLRRAPEVVTADAWHPADRTTGMRKRTFNMRV